MEEKLGPRLGAHVDGRELEVDMRDLRDSFIGFAVRNIHARIRHSLMNEV